MELETRRRANDTFPVYMSFNLDKAFPGALSTGFLPPRFSVVDINPDAAVKGMALDEKAVALLEERWRLLTELRQRIRDVRQGPDGLLYLLTDETPGALLRIEPAQ